MQLPTNTQSANSIALNKPTLSRGSKGNDVRELQRLLIHWGLGSYDIFIDGVFDEILEYSVKAYQCRVFLTEDGIVGSLTWQSLYTGAPVNMPELRRGHYGLATSKVQEVLQICGDYNGKIDGDFGWMTEQAVKAFQKRVGLVADGVVGNRTWHALSKVPREGC
ncbi:peptidoglycan-binding protein [Geitlerinema splendidum]|nr:peptidoglycan-binding protein [Geitlerinema splendidum]